MILPYPSGRCPGWCEPCSGRALNRLGTEAAVMADAADGVRAERAQARDLGNDVACEALGHQVEVHPPLHLRGHGGDDKSQSLDSRSVEIEMDVDGAVAPSQHADATGTRIGRGTGAAGSSVKGGVRDLDRPALRNRTASECQGCAELQDE